MTTENVNSSSKLDGNRPARGQVRATAARFSERKNMLYKIYINDTENEITLCSYDEYEIQTIVGIALKNGYKDLSILEAVPEEKLEYDLRKSKQRGEETNV